MYDDVTVERYRTALFILGMRK